MTPTKCTLIYYISITRSSRLFRCVAHHLQKERTYSFLTEGITKCSKGVYNKFTYIRQHNNYLLDK